MDSDSSETNLIIVTKRARVKWFLKLYWKTILLILVPFVLLPIYYLGTNNAYKTLYVFLVTMVYLMSDLIHPAITSIVPITLFTLFGINMYLNLILPVGNELFDCISIMIIMIAIENCNLNRRIAVKILLIFGYSHYRLSLLLFFCTMFLSMWLTDIIACGLMMPLLKAILKELEKMGIFEMHHTLVKSDNRPEHEQKNPKPTDFTVFYFLGIAYSASIGSLATIIGSKTNQIFQMYSESLFPLSPKIEFPHVVLLNLPGVILIEALLYVWMNSYFLGMFRSRTDMALEIGISEEEAQYISTLLTLQYSQLGNISFHEYVVGVILILTCILQLSFGYKHAQNDTTIRSNSTAIAPCMLSVVLLFVTPSNLECIKFFKRDGTGPLPILPGKSCLNWKLVYNNVKWSVLFIIVSSSSVFSSLAQSGLIAEAGGALVSAREWPAPVLALLVILLCKVLGETASGTTVAYCVLPTVARLSVASSVNPHYLMLAATLASSLPFHLVTGSPVNAMVAAYVHIPAWKMMSAGVGPSVITVVVVWFTVAVWSKVVWPDVHSHPLWADNIANITF